MEPESPKVGVERRTLVIGLGGLGAAVALGVRLGGGAAGARVAVGGAHQQVRNTITNYSIVPYQSTHVQGGAIMGADPSTSVVNKYSQVWGVPNLFVVGAANFPQNAGYNPTGTVGALAFNAADAIVSRYLPSPGMLA